MKRLFLFSAFILCSLATMAFEVDGISYNITSTDNLMVEVTSSSSGYSGDIVIPGQVESGGNTYSVTSIGQSAFSNCTGLSSVTIPNSVTSISSYAFKGCSSLTSITFPNSVTTIGKFAFYNCSSLTSINIPNSVTSIGASAFSNTPWYNNQPDGVVYAGKVAYKYKGTMPSNTSVVLEDGTLGIGQGAFSNCSGLISITIPSSVTSIGIEAFSGCNGLTSVHISDLAAWCNISFNNSLTDYNDDPTLSYSNPLNFAHHLYLNGEEVIELVIPDGVTTIGQYAFCNCNNLISVTIPESVTSIGNGAFTSCTGLQKVNITDLESWCNIVFESVGANPLAHAHYLFLNGKRIDNLVIPRTTYGLSYTFCYGYFSSVTMNAGTGYYQFGHAQIGEITVKHAVGWEAFRSATINHLVIDPSVTEVGNLAFYYSKIEKLEIPYANTHLRWVSGYDSDGLFEWATIGTAYVDRSIEASFYGSHVESTFNETTISKLTVGSHSNFNFLCYYSTITDLFFDNNVTEIPGYAFYFGGGGGPHSTITNIHLPQNITSIGSKAFYDYGSNVFTENRTPAVIDENTFNNRSGKKLYVPVGSKTAYEAADYWKDFSIIEYTPSIFFTDANVKAICVQNWDTDGDGELSYEEAAAVTNLGTVFAHTDIKSFDELEYFTGLTSIGQSAFSSCSCLTSLTIPNSVTSIGDYAFQSCSGLTLTIPNSVTSIGDYAFSYCSGLTLTIPNSVTSIGYDAFNVCKGLLKVNCNIPDASNSYSSPFYDSAFSSVIIGDDVTCIGKYAFYGNSSLISVTIGNGVTSIGNSAFYNCTGLTSVTIPNSVTSIGDNAFYYCRGLTSLTIPNSVTSIGISAFNNCTGLKTVTIGSGVTSIGYNAFQKCTGSLIVNCNIPDASNSYSSPFYDSAFSSVIIGDDVTSIGKYAFYGNSCLTFVTIPESVTSIGNSAFSGCSSLTSLTIPESVTSVGNSAFNGCSGLTSLTIPNSVTSIGNSAFNGCTGSLIVNCNIPDASNYYSSPFYNSSFSSLIIGDDVTSIGQSAFSHCSSLISVTIGNSVTSIGNSAFSGCSSLTSLTIPESVTSVGNSAFSGCSSLTSVTIPNSVTSIGEYTFASCSGLTSVSIGNSVTSIGSYAFSECSHLTSVSIGSSVTNIGDYAFCYCLRLMSITIPNSVTTIGESAFSDCSHLTSVTFGTSVTSIGNNAFSGCSGLTVTFHCREIGQWFSNSGVIKEIIIGDEVTTIGEKAFYNSSLTSVSIGRSVTSIDYYAFRNCSSITSVTFHCNEIGQWFSNSSSIKEIIIGDEVTNIGHYAFSGCSGLTEVTIPNSVTSIGQNAFSNCTGLSSVTIPNSVTSIERYAFNGCSSLTEVTIPNSVTSIGDSAFFGCRRLTSITIPNSVTSIGFHAFEGCSGLTSVHITDLAAWCNISFVDNPLCYARHLYLNGKEVKGDLVIPNSVTSIGNSAFYYCTGLTSVTIPNSVTSIGYEAFYGCSGLTTVKVCMESPANISDETFSNRANATLYVPKGSKEAYQYTSCWGEFKAIVEFPNSDVNQDGTVNMADVVDIARFVVGIPRENFVEFLADLNNSGEVNVADAVVLVNEIAGDQNFAKAYGAPSTYMGVDRLTLTENNDHSLSLAMESQRSYTAFQFDLYTNSEDDVMAMALNAARKNGHQLLYNKMDEGHYRVVALSVANNGFNGNNGELLNIQLDGFNSADMTIGNIHFITTDGTDYRFDDLSLGSATGTESLTPAPSPEGEGSIYDLSGRKVSDSSVIPQGVYIVNGKKVIVK